ncbi:glycosyltransferase family 2 protein [Paenibacillus kobensis]|uniref:glycosyltransferase family 2 protein n=1 Tax=Paenibacillus kobensis TaxID=59841 RepID=UPI000FD8D4DD|nr:glycosyltransferase [Paenibacillus kobensis]
MNRWIEGIMYFFGWTIFCYMAIVILVYSVMLVFAQIELRRQYKLDKRDLEESTIDAVYSKPVSIIVPVYNEQAGVIDSIYSLLSLKYPQTELLVVNDGSKDGTLQLVMEHFRMVCVDKPRAGKLETKRVTGVYQSAIHSHLWLIDKENGGKADALNAGINYSRYPYFCSIDGDSILEENSLLRVMKPIILSNGAVAAAGGNVRIVNGFHVQNGAVHQTMLSNSALIVMQVIEYLRAFLMGRIALSRWNMVLIISGAFSVFNKKLVVEVGGYSCNTIGEDMELVVKLHRFIKEQDLDNRIEFVPDPVCWTEAPQTLKGLRNQRRRWHQGLIQSLWAHKRMTFNPKYGAVGLISFPYFWLVECLGPLIEIGGYIYVVAAFFLGNIYYEFAILLMLLFILYGTLFSIASVLLEAWSMNTYPRRREVIRMILLAMTEVFWYKPLSLFWRVEGLIRFLLRRKTWGQIARVGFSEKGAAE